MFPVTVIGEAPQVDRTISVNTSGDEKHWRIPEERPVAFVYNKRNYAVMLATPQDIVDYVLGFSLTEGIVDALDGILGLEITFAEIGVDLRIKITDEYLERFELRQRRRNMPGNAGCGVCGLENADAFFAKLPVVSSRHVELDKSAVLKAMTELSELQPINQKTRSVHGAAWVSPTGQIKLVREDVGRHNALDKLLGALAIQSDALGDGFVLMSSRCSYELVEKAARCGVKALASISGPTGFALEKAREANMTIYARSPDGVVQLNP